MKPLLERLHEAKPLVADGAMGTMLFRQVLRPGHCPESVNLEHANVLQDIAREYADAGADIVQTNTFGASPLKLAHYHLDTRTEDIIRIAVNAARAGAAGRAYVSGSCGPCGKILTPYGDTEPQVVHDAFLRQIKALIDAGVDVICIETMTDLAEAVIAIKAAKEVAPGTPAMATMTFDPTPKGFRTIMGASIEQSVHNLREAGADVIGSNCGSGIGTMIAIAREFCALTDCPVLIQPNAGLPDTSSGEPVYTETPEFMADHARELLAVGVKIIGGCCGTTPAHTRALRALVDTIKPQ